MSYNQEEILGQSVILFEFHEQRLNVETHKVRQTKLINQTNQNQMPTQTSLPIHIMKQSHVSFKRRLGLYSNDPCD